MISPIMSEIQAQIPLIREKAIEEAVVNAENYSRLGGEIQSIKGLAAILSGEAYQSFEENVFATYPKPEQRCYVRVATDLESRYFSTPLRTRLENILKHQLQST